MKHGLTVLSSFFYPIIKPIGRAVNYLERGYSG